MNLRSIRRIPLLVAALGLLATGVSARQQAAPAPSADRVTVPLSDPSRPALIDVSLVQGSITVRGSNRKDVGVVAMPGADRPRRRYDANADGLRRLPQTAGFRISEEGNRVKIGSDDPGRSINFEIEVPLRSNLKLSAVNDGEILIENVDGELEVTNVNGGIVMNSVAGIGDRRHDQRDRPRDPDAGQRPARDGVHVAEWDGRRHAAAGHEGQPADAQQQRRRVLGL